MAFADKLERIKEALPWRHGVKAAAVPVTETRRPIEQMSDARLLTPELSIYENDKELIIHADVPGANAKGTQVHCAGDVIELAATTTASPDGRVIGLCEHEQGTWYRKLELPHYADGERARSSLKLGVLTIHIPKRKLPAGRSIPVKSA